MLCKVRGLSHGSFILTEGDGKSKEERRAGQKLRTCLHTDYGKKSQEESKEGAGGVPGN